MEVGVGRKGFTSYCRAVCWTPQASGMLMFSVYSDMNACGALASYANVSKIAWKLWFIAAVVSGCVL